jgi:hypothetical protein
MGVAADEGKKDAAPAADANKLVCPPPTPDHMSQVAYPDAVISLKDGTSGILFYVEGNGRRLVAFDKEGAVKWRVDVMAEAKINPRGTAVIRHLHVKDGVLWVTCGRSHYAKVNLLSGKAEFAGND